MVWVLIGFSLFSTLIKSRRMIFEAKICSLVFTFGLISVSLKKKYCLWASVANTFYVAKKVFPLIKVLK